MAQMQQMQWQCCTVCSQCMIHTKQLSTTTLPYTPSTKACQFTHHRRSRPASLHLTVAARYCSYAASHSAYSFGLSYVLAPVAWL